MGCAVEAKLLIETDYVNYLLHLKEPSHDYGDPNFSNVKWEANDGNATSAVQVLIV
jgi:hypothetical protein